MTARWEHELRSLGTAPAPISKIERRAGMPPRRRTGRDPSTTQRVVAGIVAACVFAGAGLLAWRALGGADVSEPVRPESTWAVATITLASGPGGRTASLAYADDIQEGWFGEADDPDTRYPYDWVNPEIRRPIELPLGVELRIDGDVMVREVLFGDADELDDGAKPDSGPLSSDQPDLSRPYFPVQGSLDREYWKLFGTWGDGSVLDVYFEVRWVRPGVDASDTSAELVIDPSSFRADLYYGGHHIASGGDGNYGGAIVVSERVPYGPETIYFPVAAGSSMVIAGNELDHWSVTFGEEGSASSEGATPMTFPDQLGPTTMWLSAEGGGWAQSYRLPIRIVSVPLPVTHETGGWAPPYSERDGVVTMPLTFPDGLHVTIEYPASLGLHEMYVGLDDGVDGPSGCGYVLNAFRQDPTLSWIKDQPPLAEFIRQDGSIVGLYEGQPSFAPYDYLVYRFGSWNALVGCPQGGGHDMASMRRWAEGISGQESPEGLLVVEGSADVDVHKWEVTIRFGDQDAIVDLQSMECEDVGGDRSHADGVVQWCLDPALGVYVYANGDGPFLQALVEGLRTS
jgi:hypothetical protein